VTPVPKGWLATPAPEGVGVDVRVSARRRPLFVAVLAVLAGLALIHGWSEWPWRALGACLTLLALWCTFGDEVWHVETNRLVHRVGAGGLGWSRAYLDAALALELWTSTKFNVPYYRLYVVVGNERHWLIDRRYGSELPQLAAFLADQTGWRLL
jgi:hypothetical protein